MSAPRPGDAAAGVVGRPGTGGSVGGGSSSVGHGPLATPWKSVVAVFLAPSMWSLHELTVYVGTSNICQAGRGHERLLGVPAAQLLMLVATVVALGVSAAMIVLFWRRWRGAAHPDDGRGTLPAGRVVFEVRFGLAMAVVSAIGIVLTAMPSLMTVCGWRS